MSLPCTVTAGWKCQGQLPAGIAQGWGTLGLEGGSSTHTSTSGKSFNLLGKISDSSTRT